jgi:hypothetical protein
VLWNLPGGATKPQIVKHFFKDEIVNNRQWRGRIQYNPIFTKTAQSGPKSLGNSKWLIKNNEEENVCTVWLSGK